MVVVNEEAPLWSEQHDRSDEGEDAKRRTWFIAGLRKRLPHLADLLPWLETQLRIAGVTWRTEGFGGPRADVELSCLGRQCVTYLNESA
jgi:hypothetical protein